MLYLWSMKKRFQSKTAILFTVLFLAIVSTPAVIASMDDSIDITNFDGLGEEEETESFKLICEDFDGNLEEHLEDSFGFSAMQHALKNYSKPYLNQVSPPPES